MIGVDWVVSSSNIVADHLLLPPYFCLICFALVTNSPPFSGLTIATKAEFSPQGLGVFLLLLAKSHNGSFLPGLIIPGLFHEYEHIVLCENLADGSFQLSVIANVLMTNYLIQIFLTLLVPPFCLTILRNLLCKLDLVLSVHPVIGSPKNSKFPFFILLKG